MLTALSKQPQLLLAVLAGLHAFYAVPCAVADEYAMLGKLVGYNARIGLVQLL